MNTLMMINLKRIKMTMRWRIRDMLRKRWARLWLLIFSLALIFYLGNFWMKSFLHEAQIDDSMYSMNERPFYDYWGKDRLDARWLVHYMESRRSDIPTFVVEEHYEVLKYWFQAAELGLLSKSRNTLLHIDGHIDAAFPANAESIPWFRFPNSEEEVQNMMQRNDMFIVSSALAGFLDHVIWVWPSWAASNEEDEEEFAYAVYDVYLGDARIKSITHGGYDRDLCVCLRKRLSLEEVDGTSGWICHRQNKTIVDMENGLKIGKSACSRQVDGILEIMSESLAAGVLKKHKFSESKKLLLDIDEDFFGCWSDVIPLSHLGLKKERLETLSELVSYLFCATTAEEEQLADRFYVSLLSVIRTLKSRGCANEEFQSENRCLRNVEIENFVILNIDEIQMFLMQESMSQVLCESGTKVSGLFLQSLMSYLMNFSIEQLTALAQLGICFNVSPPSAHFSSSGQFHVCYGDNTPNQTLVQFYMPEKSDVHFRALKLRRMLSSLSRQPDMISISRSVRDGYTPKNVFDLIETTMMDTIHTVFRQTYSSHVHYDQNLLGGRAGWYSRPQPIVSQLLKFLDLN